LLAGAGLLEIVRAIALKHTGGFTRFWPSALGISAAVVSFVMLAQDLAGRHCLRRLGRRGALRGRHPVPGRDGIAAAHRPFLALVLVGIEDLKLVEA
jgi:quaternary ammonium compound-resistance protein SugE